jgi:tRNA(fMet)-specific endonuclease VapC
VALTRLLLDTNCVTDAFRGDAQTIERLETAHQVWLPCAAVAELRAGFLGGSRSATNEALLDTFLRMESVGILYADRETLGVYARLRVQLRRSGTPIPTNDLWIASLAVQHDLILLTRDAHFDKLPQLQRSL